MPLNSFVREFLTFLEQQEIRLLSWGFYDVSFDQFEVERLLLEEGHANLLALWRTVKDEGWTISSLLEEMEHNGLLYRVTPGEDHYRTRFAEGVRLIARLRQRFKLKDWATGPPLVSDIKLHLAPRKYPRRDQSASECWRDIEEVSWEPDLQREAFDALSVNSSGEPIQFANFQRKAFKAILTSYQGKGFTGSVISAGTGSGKTKGFYIPALLGAITELPPRQQPFTKIIAIYPRNVLLADQLREAISEATKIQPVLERFGLRSLTFGALLGMTPEQKKFTRDENGKYPVERIGWKRIGSGFIVPFLKSPQAPDQDLIWRDHDRLAGSTALYRVGGDSHQPDLSDGTLILTREELQTNPPDVLFLSAEMLNREMGNPDWAKTFGIQQGRLSPRLLLLDEVHSYEGVNGAQIAWVFRRWRYWSGTHKLHFVGLSATLKEAQKHLGQVAGIPSAAIQEFAPLDSELDMRDVEYNLAIKGDPSSGASLLATSIQTGMLLARLLTPRNVPYTFSADHQVPGPSLYGRKVFGFTDNLDGLNRWYSDMSDAESNLRLAHLRLHPEERQPPSVLPQATLRAMDRDGQIWELPRRLGHNLAQPLRVSRCSSQDPGANTGSDLIVASASLEVGFDDPEVGAVLHHKKPISVSSFIQRKGRAGRRLGTRPWTAVVLSDYGADRWAFQNAERLFQPAIESIFLPISNPYVLRIQATYFLVDWLGRRLGKGSPFRYLAYYNGEVANRLIKILKDFLVLGPEWKDFRRDFHRVFSRPQGTGFKILSETELDAILWRTPRPILRHVVPALLRKVQAHWRYANPRLNQDFEDRAANRPLPQYLPAATFSELGGIDARLLFPPPEQREDEYLSISRALFEACPGRVSKRYALRVREEGYWLKFSSQLLQRPGSSTTSTRELFRDRILIKEVDGVLVYQPQAFELDHRPSDVLDSSNASWNWQSQITPFSHGVVLPIFYASPWNTIVNDCRAYLHRDYSGIEVLRFSRSSTFEIRLKKGRTTRGLLTLQSVTKGTQQQDEAVGFELEADGIVVTLTKDILQNYVDRDETRTSRFRPDYYLSQMRSCPLLSQSMNSFLLEWMWQTSLAMLTATSVEKRCPLSEAQAILKGNRLDAAKRVMDSIFQIREVGTAGEESEARLRDRIIDQWSDSAVVTRLEELERLLWEPLDQPYQSWVKQRYVATLAQAFRAAVVSRLSDISEDDLIVDVICREDNVEIYLTETGGGGLGQIEGIVKELRKSPERFIDGLKFSIAFCRRNFIASNLLELVGSVVSIGDNDNLRAAFATARAAKGFDQMAEAKQSLQQALEQAGFDSSRDIIVAVVTKLLRAGSSPRSDATIHLLNRAWRRREIKLGIGIDARTFAYICIHYAPARRRLVQLFRELSGGEDPTDSQLYAVVQQLLLPGCDDSCPECLDHPNQFNDFGHPSRSLVLDSIRLGVTEVYVREHPKDWLDQARRVLLSEFRTRLVVEPLALAQVASALQAFLAEELDACNLLLPISITAIERTGVNWSITLQIRDVSNE